MPADASFPYLSLSGSHREIGRQHGEALRGPIRAHLVMIVDRAATNSNLRRGELLRLAGTFAPLVERYSPDLMEEIRGLAEGAGLSSNEAMALQVRQELVNRARYAREDLECTSFAVSGPYTEGGAVFAGQNADLAGGVETFAAVFALAPAGKPRVLLVAPAGQVSYIGMNSEGLAACANFLRVTAWRPGYPRYLLTRLALEQRTLAAAVDAVLAPVRASSRNILLADARGNAVDLELTAQTHAVLPAGGCFVHTNHFLSPELAPLEASKQHELRNSRSRHARMTTLLRAKPGRLAREDLAAALCDHENGEDSICWHGGTGDVHTFASFVAAPAEGRMDIAVGPPCAHAFQTYRL